jgi:hypothetical protein
VFFDHWIVAMRTPRARPSNVSAAVSLCPQKERVLKGALLTMEYDGDQEYDKFASHGNAQRHADENAVE